MANAYFYTSTAVQTQLTGSISAGATTATVGDTTGWPVSFPFIAAFDYGSATEELVKVTANSANTLTIVRAFNGTSASSHSLGAIVRHVYCAQDATDFRTHEAASTGVHGITGAVVGTTDTQVLSAKTLTSPTINAGALSGTFTGAPTFSGAVVLSGGPNISAGGALAGTFAGTPTFSGLTSFTGGMKTSGALVTTLVERAFVTGDTNDRLQVQADGTLNWGSGAAATDVSLFRSAVNNLTLNGNFFSNGTISATNFPIGAWQAFTPGWSTSTGLHVPTIGNGTLAMRYQLVGKTVFFVMRLKAGSTTNYNSGTSSDNWLFTLPITASASINAGGNGSSFPIGVASMAYNGTDPKAAGGMAYLNTTGDFTVQVSTGEIDAVAIASTGFIDAVTPSTWTIAGYLTITGTYEAA